MLYKKKFQAIINPYDKRPLTKFNPSHHVYHILFGVFMLLLSIHSHAEKTVNINEEKKQTEITPENEPIHVKIEVETNLGKFQLQLDKQKAPISVANFIQYLNEGFYEETIFHRVIPDFMIQGGGFKQGMLKKNTNPPIKNEAKNGLKNTRGSIAMARTGEINSATSQFFINLQNNPFLDHGVRDYGYAVFGRVTQGMSVIDKIASVPTSRYDRHQNVPDTPVVILGVKIIQ